MASAIDVLLCKLRSIAELWPEDLQTLSTLPVRLAELRAGEDVVQDGDRPGACCLLIDGFMHRYKLLENGRRQILAIHTPGDLPDLQSLVLRTMDHGLAALSACRVGFISHESLRAAMRSSSIAEAFWRDTLIDAAIFRTWITLMGRRPAHDHLAHLLCEVFTRLQAVGMADQDRCALPMTQNDLADALGLSTVHVNRTLQVLRGEGLIKLDRGWLTILDWAGLVRSAKFDPTYLHLRETLRAA